MPIELPTHHGRVGAVEPPGEGREPALRTHPTEPVAVASEEGVEQLQVRRGDPPRPFEDPGAVRERVNGQHLAERVPGDGETAPRIRLPLSPPRVPIHDPAYPEPAQAERLREVAEHDRAGQPGGGGPRLSVVDRVAHLIAHQWHPPFPTPVVKPTQGFRVDHGAAGVVNLERVDPGYDEEVFTLRVAMTPRRYQVDERVRMHGEIVHRILEQPGVTHAAAITFHPLSGGTFRLPVARSDETAPSENPPQAMLRSITPSYFRTMGMAMGSGRPLASGDRADAEPVVVINESLARAMFPDEDPVDRWITVGRNDGPRSAGQPGAYRIVGVVADVKELTLDGGGGARSPGGSPWTSRRTPAGRDRATR